MFIWKQELYSRIWHGLWENAQYEHLGIDYLKKLQNINKRMTGIKWVHILHLESSDIVTLHLRPHVDGERRALLVQSSILFWLKRCQRWPWQTHELNISLWFLHNLQSPWTINWIVLKKLNKRTVALLYREPRPERNETAYSKSQTNPIRHLENKTSVTSPQTKRGMSVYTRKKFYL